MSEGKSEPAAPGFTVMELVRARERGGQVGAGEDAEFERMRVTGKPECCIPQLAPLSWCQRVCGEDEQVKIRGAGVKGAECSGSVQVDGMQVLAEDGGQCGGEFGELRVIIENVYHFKN